MSAGTVTSSGPGDGSTAGFEVITEGPERIRSEERGIEIGESVARDAIDVQRTFGPGWRSLGPEPGEAAKQTFAFAERSVTN